MAVYMTIIAPTVKSAVGIQTPRLLRSLSSSARSSRNGMRNDRGA